MLRGKVFIPASQVSDRYVRDLKEYLWQTITFVIVEFNKQKKRIIGSRRTVLAEEKSGWKSSYGAALKSARKLTVR